jgi:hypothetical protein
MPARAGGRPVVRVARDRLVKHGMDGTAFADEVAASARRIGIAAASGSLVAVTREASRLDRLAEGYRSEARRFSGAFEHPDGPERAA